MQRCLENANNKEFFYAFALFCNDISDYPLSTATKDTSTHPMDELTQNIHGFFQLGTDHVWRGISFSNHLPEIFGSLLYMFPAGIYGGVVAYDTMLTMGGIGVVPIIGIKGEHNRLSYDVSARYEAYPKYVTLVTPNIFEAYGEVGYALFESLKVAGGLGYSPNYYFESGNGLYGNAMLVASLPKKFVLDGGIGYQMTQKGGDPGNIWFKDYVNWAIGIGRDFKNDLKIGFRYTQTNLNNTECHDFGICSPAYNLYVKKTF